ncbi:hypothetical protein VULLAG_LOCUS6035 [Vulpes lagopus]
MEIQEVQRLGTGLQRVGAWAPRVPRPGQPGSFACDITGYDEPDSLHLEMNISLWKGSPSSSSKPCRETGPKFLKRPPAA